MYQEEERRSSENACTPSTAKHRTVSKFKHILKANILQTFQILFHLRKYCFQGRQALHS